MNELYNGDCLEVMQTIQDKTIDLILCDLPYGTINCKWDVIIDFDKLWLQYDRILKEDGVVALFSTQPFTTQVINSNIKEYRYTYYWKKTKKTFFHHSKNRPLTTIEEINIFSKFKYGHETQMNGKRMRYYPQGVVSNGIKKFKGCSRVNGKGVYGERKNQIGNIYESFTNFPDNFLEYNSVVKGEHPTQKPVPLLEHLIKTYTKENELVLDNCMGSGSTGVACKNINRNFIGIEKDNTYFEIAKKRIEINKLF